MDDDGLLRMIMRDLGAGGRLANTALRRLHDRYARRFLGLLGTRGLAKEDAEEIVQDLLLKVIHQREKISTAESPRAYMYRMLRNCEVDFRRKKSPPEMLDIDLVEKQLPSQPQTRDGFLDCLSRVLALFEDKEPERALAFRVAVIEGFTGKELAQALDRTHSAARQFLYESRKKFIEIFRDRCADYMPVGNEGG